MSDEKLAAVLDEIAGIEERLARLRAVVERLRSETRARDQAPPAKAPPAADTPQPGAELMTEKQVRELLQVCRKTLWNWRQADPTFPRPVRLGPTQKAVRFKAAEVRAWIKGQG